MNSEQKDQLILILRFLAVNSCRDEGEYRCVEDAIRDLSDMFMEDELEKEDEL